MGVLGSWLLRSPRDTPPQVPPGNRGTGTPKYPPGNFPNTEHCVMVVVVVVVVIWGSLLVIWGDLGVICGDSGVIWSSLFVI